MPAVFWSLPSLRRTLCLPWMVSLVVWSQYAQWHQRAGYWIAVHENFLRIDDPLRSSSLAYGLGNSWSQLASLPTCPTCYYVDNELNQNGVQLRYQVFALTIMYFPFAFGLSSIMLWGLNHFWWCMKWAWWTSITVVVSTSWHFFVVPLLQLEHKCSNQTFIHRNRSLSQWLHHLSLTFCKYWRAAPLLSEYQWLEGDTWL